MKHDARMRRLEKLLTPRSDCWNATGADLFQCVERLACALAAHRRGEDTVARVDELAARLAALRKGGSS